MGDSKIKKAKDLLNEVDDEIDIHSFVFVNYYEWATYIHMKIHLNMLSQPDFFDSLLIDPRNAENYDEKTPKTSSIIPHEIMPTIQDIKKLLLEKEDILKSEERENILPSLANWLNICAVCSRNKSKLFSLFPPSIFKLTKRNAYYTKDPEDKQQKYSRIFTWDHKKLYDNHILLAIDSAWTDYSEAPVANIYWRQVSENTKGLEAQYIPEIKEYAKEIAKGMTFLEDQKEDIILNFHQMNNMSFYSFIACIFAAETLPRIYDIEDIEYIYEEFIKDLLEGPESINLGNKCLRSIIYNNQSIISLTKREIKTSTKPPKIYYSELSNNVIQRKGISS